MLIVSSPKLGARGVMSPKVDKQKVIVKERDGLEATKEKPKRCRWKLQARNVDKSIKHKDRPKAMKKSSDEIF